MKVDGSFGFARGAFTRSASNLVYSISPQPATGSTISFKRTEFGPEVIKNTDKQFILACYGSGTWTLIMRKNNEF